MTPCIAIIDCDVLAATGLRIILDDMFVGVELLTYPSVDPLTRRSARVSMGTVFQIPWTKASKEESEGTALISILRSHGYKTAAMALTDDSTGVDDDEVRSSEKLAVFLGTEGTGLPDEVTAACDHRIMIPMHHGVDSLNVAAAGAVCFWELMKPRQGAVREPSP